MSFVFRIRTYLEYRRRARGRHGTHSPFVYDFADRVIGHQGQSEIWPDLLFEGANKRTAEILGRIKEYYELDHVLNLSGSLGAGMERPDLLILTPGSPGNWATQISENFPDSPHYSMVVVPLIHSDNAHLEAWKKLCSQQPVRMSIDLFQFGLLLYREEFRALQHFVLKR